MIPFQSFAPESRALYDAYLFSCGERGCEYSFVNLYLWGRQKAAFLGNSLLFFSQFNRRSVYLFPVCKEDPRQALEAIMADAAKRGIPCRLTGLLPQDCEALEALFPGRFRFHPDRDSYDYLYDINDLAELKGRKFQKKRNHLNRFRQAHPDYYLEPVTPENTQCILDYVNLWYARRLEDNPHADYLMERSAIEKALAHWEALGLEGLILRDGEDTLAFAIGSRLSADTFDIHFEKSLDTQDGAYAAINQGFAAYLRQKYPELAFLNREDDMGIEGLRKAKLSWCPHRLIEKSWACLLEDCYDY